MNVLNLISTLRKFNLALRLEQDNLKITGDIKSAPEDLINEIRSNKKAIIDFLNDSKSKETEAIARIPVQSHYPLSNAQERIWVLSQFEGGNQAYNIASGFHIKGYVDVGHLNTAFQYCFNTHESLRTVFKVIGDAPVQVIKDSVPFSIEQECFKYAEDKRQR